MTPYTFRIHPSIHLSFHRWCLSMSEKPRLSSVQPSLPALLVGHQGIPRPGERCNPSWASPQTSSHLDMSFHLWGIQQASWILFMWRSSISEPLSPSLRLIQDTIRRKLISTTRMSNFILFVAVQSFSHNWGWECWFSGKLTLKLSSSGLCSQQQISTASTSLQSLHVSLTCERDHLHLHLS